MHIWANSAKHRHLTECPSPLFANHTNVLRRITFSSPPTNISILIETYSTRWETDNGVVSCGKSIWTLSKWQNIVLFAENRVDKSLRFLGHGCFYKGNWITNISTLRIRDFSMTETWSLITIRMEKLVQKSF